MRLNRKETAPSFACAPASETSTPPSAASKSTRKPPWGRFAKRIPSIAAAALGVVLLGILLAPAEPEESGLVLARALSWKTGKPMPCVGAARERFHSFVSESEWGEFYLSRSGAYLYPPAAGLGAEESPSGDAALPRHCSPVASPSQIEEF